MNESRRGMSRSTTDEGGVHCIFNTQQLSATRRGGANFSAPCGDGLISARKSITMTEYNYQGDGNDDTDYDVMTR